MSSNPPSVHFISIPGKSSKEESLRELQSLLNSKQHGEIGSLCPVRLPDFKVGTLDSLVVLSDELVKNDAVIESVVFKISESLRNLLNNDQQQFVNNLLVGDKKVDAYLQHFSWNSMKYRTDIKSLKELADTVQQEVTAIDTLMKTKLQAYSQAKGNLKNLERKQVGNLAVKSLNALVKKEHFVLDSEYLQTLLVAVPKSLHKDWIDSYETLTQMVVPRSTTKIAEDDEFVLVNVTLFQRVVDEFTVKAREKKFIVREFKWDPEALSNEKKQYTEATNAEREQWTTLIRLCKTNFGELYSCWIHLKAIRVFVETILRYGLPPNYVAGILIAKPKQEQKVRDVLNKHYAYLDGSDKLAAAAGQLDENVQHLLGEKDYSPFVLFGINAVY